MFILPTTTVKSKCKKKYFNHEFPAQKEGEVTFFYTIVTQYKYYFMNE